ncbi:DNA primase [Erwinia typographi]|uniref:DNA primase n=1 Tax=Erwinia typographi TaxID=371042 RepID=A0A0A4A7R1_9GAMM|nr:zincin-like metallopeptidase domain-containing protein [Erwinia typographi]KGT93878.1 DNA primase [Erwinia typographi]
MPTKRKPRKSQTNQVDLYQQVTDKIVASIELGVLPWRKPWRDSKRFAESPIPSNASTGRHYNGINIMLLWLSAEEQGFNSNRWLTWKQAQAAGGNVRKGEKATVAVFFKPFEVESTDKAGQPHTNAQGDTVMEQRIMLRSIMLFNIEQCEGLPEKIIGAAPEILDDESVDTLSAPVFNDIVTIAGESGVRVSYSEQNRAYYNSMKDQIVLPLRKQFFTEADFCSTLLHELVHATGHHSRLDREGITSTSRTFGDPVYAFEELIAELGSAFLCAHLGVYGEVQHDSYIDHWLKILKSDKKALFRACRMAREASEHLLKPLHEAAEEDAA